MTFDYILSIIMIPEYTHNNNMVTFPLLLYSISLVFHIISFTHKSYEIISRDPF